MTRRNQMAAYLSPPAYYGSSPAYLQPVGFWDDPYQSMVDIFGSPGNFRGDAPPGTVPPFGADLMPGVPVSTADGAYQAGAAVSDAAGALVAPVGEFAKGLLRGVGVYVALGIIGYTLINAGKK